MPGIKLENKNMVDLGLGPNHAIAAKEQKVKNDKKEATVNLPH